MTTYQLTQHDLPPKTVTAQCFHVDDDFVRFHDADHQLVYAVQRGLLLAGETVTVDEDQDATVPEPEDVRSQVTHFVFEVDTRPVTEALARAQRAAQRLRPNPFY